jgi:hypothetical protein
VSRAKARAEFGAPENAATEPKHTGQGRAAIAKGSFQKGSAEERLFVTMPAERLPQDPGAANYRGQKGRFMRVFHWKNRVMASQVLPEAFGGFKA